MKVRKTTGHPLKQDPDVVKLFKAMKSTTELVRDLDSRLHPETLVMMQSASLALMIAYSEITGLPSPLESIPGVIVEQDPNDKTVATYTVNAS